MAKRSSEWEARNPLVRVKAALGLAQAVERGIVQRISAFVTLSWQIRKLVRVQPLQYFCETGWYFQMSSFTFACGGGLALGGVYVSPENMVTQ